MEIEYRFVPDGTVAADVGANVFFVDVGSYVHPRVFDHHAGAQGRDFAPAAMIWDARSAILNEVAVLDQVVIVTHQQPDWNACWGVCLLKWLLENRELDPIRVKALNDFSAHVLRGFNPSEGPAEKSLLAVFLTLATEVEEKEADPAVRDRRKLDIGSAFFQFCYDFASCYEDLKTGRFLSEDGPFGEAMLTVREDYRVYLRDLQKASRFTAAVRRRSGEVERIDGLKVRAPDAKLFRFWARRDITHSYSQAGFPLTWVEGKPRNWIISTDPASGFVMEGLGDFLTAEECRIRPPDPSKEARPGYDCPDPWYDARNTPTASTMVASPKDGTALTPKELERLLKNFFRVKKWAPAVERVPWVRAWLLPYAVPAFCVAAMLLIGWWVYVQPWVGCRQWANLPEIQLTDGKYVAVVIGVNDYSRAWTVDETGKKVKLPDLKTPVDNATRFFKWLTEQGGFEKALTPDSGGKGVGSLLIVGGDTVKPNYNNIKNRIKDIAGRINDDNKTDYSLLIYFSGHGKMDKQFPTFGYWIPEDGESDATYIDNTWLQGVLAVCKARHVLVIADCCHAGKLFDGKDQSADSASSSQAQSCLPTSKRDPGMVNTKALYNKRSRQGLTSTLYEYAPDTVSFSDCLLKELKKFQDEGSQYITIFDVYPCINNCLRKAKVVVNPKLGIIKDACDNEGQFIFRLK